MYEPGRDKGQGVKLPLGFTKVRKGLYCEITRTSHADPEAAANFFDGDASHHEALRASKHGTYVQVCFDSQGLYLLDHRTLSTRTFPVSNGVYDRVIGAALEEQWKEWWNDMPSGGRFELCGWEGTRRP